MPSTTQTVREIALQQPTSIRVFERFGIDYCCGGHKPLDETCSAANLDVDAVLAALGSAALQSAALQSAASLTAPDAQDWSHATLQELSGHIVATHHAYIHRELPRLAVLAEKVVRRHGDTHSELPQIQSTLAQLDDELTHHLAKEEVVLFPYIVGLEQSIVEGGAKPHGCFGSVANPIAMMTAEHDAATDLMAQIRSLSRQFTPPEGACPTYHAFYHGLQEFAQDLQQHIHLENNILFPSAIHLEAGTQTSEPVVA